MEKSDDVTIVSAEDIVIIDANGSNFAQGLYEEGEDIFDPFSDEVVEIIDGKASDYIEVYDAEPIGDAFDPLGIDSPFAGICVQAEDIMEDFIDFLNESDKAVDDELDDYDNVISGFLTGSIFSEASSEDDYQELGVVSEERGPVTLADYLSEDENLAVANRLKRIEKMCNDAFRSDGFIESIRQQLDSFLDGPECRDFPDKNLRFTSKKFKSASTFRIMIRNVLLSELNRMELGAVFTDDAYQKLNNLIDTVIKEERYVFDSGRVERIRRAVYKFVKYFEGIASVVKQRPITLNTYIQQGLPLTAVARIHSTFWECPCGELVTHDTLVPLAICIAERGMREFVMVNEPVGCPSCNSILIIPEVMLKELQPKFVNLINNFRFKISGVAFYRPKWEDVEQLIPSDWRRYFNFDSAPIEDCQVESSYDRRVRGGYANLYSTLVEHWMKEVLQRSTTALKDDVSSLIQSNPDVAQALSLSRPFEDVFNRVEVAYDLDLDLRNYIFTLVHYLDNVGCFALTRGAKAFYEFCKRNNIKRYPFPQDKAIRWLTTNAPALVGLKSVVSSAGDLKDLGILPEYAPVFNYLCMLRTLARVENPVSDRYRSWCHNPHTKAAIDFLNPLYNKEKTRRPLLSLALSERDFQDVKIVYPRESFSDLYHLVNELQMNLDLSLGYSFKLQDLASDAAFCTREEFYELNEAESKRNYMIQPMYRFEEFVETFEEAGFNLFVSHVSDKRIIERAKVIYLLSRHSDLSKVFDAATSPRINKDSLLKPVLLSDEEYLNDMRNIILLFDERLPDELIQAREHMSQDAFLKMMEEATDAFDNDTRLKEAYPEVFK